MRILAPSDITVLEEKYSVGTRQLSFGERLGLALTPPMVHLRYSKNDRHDKRHVLSRNYPATVDGGEVYDILQRRQESIRKETLGWVFRHGGVLGTSALTSFLVRHYDVKTKIITLPLAAYAGGFIGKWTGDLCLGRWSEYQRDRFLGQLPPKQFIAPAI